MSLSTKLILWLSILVLLNCKQQSGFYSKKTSPTSEDSSVTETSSVPKPTDPEYVKRPSEDDEGIEGYLTNPEILTMESNSEGSQIIAKPNSVAPTGKKITIAVWQTSLVAAEAATGSKNLKTTKISVGILSCIKSSEDGSFRAAFKTTNEAIIVTAGLDCNQTVIEVRKLNKGYQGFLFYKNENRFIPFFAEKADLSKGSSPAKTPAKTTAETPAETDRFKDLNPKDHNVLNSCTDCVEAAQSFAAREGASVDKSSALDYGEQNAIEAGFPNACDIHFKVSNKPIEFYLYCPCNCGFQKVNP